MIKQMERAAIDAHRNYVSLSQGIPSIFMDEHIVRDLIPILKSHTADRYTDPQGMESLRKKLSTYLKRTSLSYVSDEILITTGAMEAFNVIFHGLFNPGDELLIFSPTYISFFNSARIAGVKPREVPLQGKFWRPDLDMLKKNISTKTRGILLCHPNNPTGTVFTKKELQKIGKLAQQYNLFILVDEVYEDIYFGDKPLYHLASDIFLKEHIVTVKSFSKNFAMSGWRIGYLCASRKIIDLLLPIHDSFVNCAPAISQYAALSGLKHADKIIPPLKNFYARKRDLASKYLMRMSAVLTPNDPGGGYYFFPCIKNCNDSLTLAHDLLIKAGVAVVPGVSFGKGGEGHIRICFGRSDAAIKKGMEKLAIYLKTYA